MKEQVFTLMVCVLTAAAESGVNRWTTTGPPDNAISEIAVDLRNPLTVYSGGSFFYRSTDGGETWQGGPVSFAPNGIAALAIDPTEPLRLFAATDTGVFRSEDGGIDWFGASVGITCKPILTLSLDATLPSRLYVYSNHAGFNPAFSCSVVFESSNGGSSWSPALTIGPIHERFFFDPVDPAVLYSLGGGVSKSTDGGSTWVAADVGLGASGDRYFWSMAIDPTQRDVIYLASSMGLFKSTDGAASWQDSSGLIENAEVRDVVVDPLNPSTVYGALDFGLVFRSKNAGGIWTNFSDGFRFPAPEIVSLRVSGDGTRLYAATTAGIFVNEIRPQRGVSPKPSPRTPPISGR
jgi:photosystem II stability/assembly factor-like uncharacterized protein